MVGITVVRATIFAIFTSLSSNDSTSARASMAGMLRGVRCIPPFTGIFFVQITLIYISQGLLQVLGSSIGALLFFAALVGGVHFLAFAPIVVIRDGTTARVGLGTSVRAARLPGSRHVGLVLLYFTVAFLAPSFVPMSSAYTVNPTVSTWAVLLGREPLPLRDHRARSRTGSASSRTTCRRRRPAAGGRRSSAAGARR